MSIGLKIFLTFLLLANQQGHGPLVPPPLSYASDSITLNRLICPRPGGH